MVAGQPRDANASEADDFFGATLATGDMNGDGQADLAVGVQFEDTTAGIKDAGAVNVIYGSGSGLRGAGSQIWNRHSSAISAGDQYGTAIAIGDYNGNGYADMAVGIPGEDAGGLKRRRCQRRVRLGLRADHDWPPELDGGRPQQH